jgi:N-acetylglucosaminyl-diphospho-decaprenol L-rhamnosyltransferase
VKALNVSIVSVSFRSAQLMIDCLRSLQSERATPGLSIRAIVIDNASGDFPAISRAVQEHGWSSWVTVLLAPRNGGFAYGNNLGIRLAFERQGADYVFLLNPDTEVRPGAIGALARFLEAHPTAGIAGSTYEHSDGSPWSCAFRFPTLISEFCSALDIGFVTRRFARWAVEQQMTPVAQRVDWISGAAMMIRPEVFQAIGGFDENYFLYYEETDFCFRASRAGFQTWYVPQSRIMHHMGQSTKVTEPWSAPKRLPDYWFESRRRYLAMTRGLRRAMLIDLLVLAVYPLGLLKQRLAGKRHTTVPQYYRDLCRHTLLRPRNRRLPPARAPSIIVAPVASTADAAAAD